MKAKEALKTIGDWISKETHKRKYNKVEIVKLSEALIHLKCITEQQDDRWIPVSERLPQLPDGKSSIPLNATILAPSGLRNTVQMTWELKRGKPTWCYLGKPSNWNVIAWQPLPEPYKEEI